MGPTTPRTRTAPRRARARGRRAVLGAMLGAGATALGLTLWGCGGSPPEPGQPIKADATLGGLGDTPGRFAIPRAIDASADGKSLWVIDRSARIQKIDAKTGRCLSLWKMPEWALGKPVGFCVAPGPDASGNWCDELLYVADTHYHRVMIFKPPPTPAPGADLNPDAKAELVARFGEYGQGPGQFILPTDIAVLLGPDGKSVERIYVGEYGGHDRISVFDGSYKFLFSFGEWGLSTATKALDDTRVVFARPQSLLIENVDGRPELIVTDSANHRIGRLTLDGKLIGWIGSPATMGDAPGAFRYPYGLASLGDGTVMVSEFGNNRVQRIRLSTGASLGCWGRAGRHEGELAEPWAVAVLGNETFVVDTGNNRILAFPTPRRGG